MKTLTHTVDSLEDGIGRLLQKMESLQQANTKLARELTDAKQIHAQLREELREKEAAFETLKTASAMLGSNQYKRDTKLKINTLIREIDLCIAQISE